MRARSKELNDEVFAANVLAFCGTAKQMEKKCKGLGIPYVPSEGALGACKALPEYGGYIVWLVHPDDFYVLLHETVHLIRYIFEERGIGTDLEYNDEVIAFYQMFWFRKLWRWFGNLKEKGDK